MSTIPIRQDAIIDAVDLGAKPETRAVETTRPTRRRRGQQQTVRLAHLSLVIPDEVRGRVPALNRGRAARVRRERGVVHRVTPARIGGVAADGEVVHASVGLVPRRVVGGEGAYGFGDGSGGDGGDGRGLRRVRHGVSLFGFDLLRACYCRGEAMTGSVLDRIALLGGVPGCGELSAQRGKVRRGRDGGRGGGDRGGERARDGHGRRREILNHIISRAGIHGRGEGVCVGCRFLGDSVSMIRSSKTHVRMTYGRGALLRHGHRARRRSHRCPGSLCARHSHAADLGRRRRRSRDVCYRGRSICRGAVQRGGRIDQAAKEQHEWEK
nr:hypothetical protein CFP56_70761 [Quercus suber]